MMLTYLYAYACFNYFPLLFDSIIHYSFVLQCVTKLTIMIIIWNILSFFLSFFLQALHGRRFDFNEPQRAPISGTAVRYCSQEHPYTESTHIYIRHIIIINYLLLLLLLWATLALIIEIYIYIYYIYCIVNRTNSCTRLFLSFRKRCVCVLNSKFISALLKLFLCHF